MFNTDVYVLTVCRTTNQTSTFGYYESQIFNVPDQEQECVFPFMYKGIEYTSCTTKDACTNCFWCGTRYSVTFDAGWGMCTELCLINQGMFCIYLRFIHKLVRYLDWARRIK